jgi:hypothetical protein
MIGGSRALGTNQPLSFYWQPQESNFPGVDALIRTGNVVWVLQSTMSHSHKDATQGLNRIFDILRSKTCIKWRLVMVGPDKNFAESARDHQKLTAEWRARRLLVYARELPFGRFSANNIEQFQNEVSTHNDHDNF